MSDKPKRPRDANQLAKLVAEIATGETNDSPAAKAEGQRKGGLIGSRVRTENLTAERRSEIAKKAAQARWSKKAD